MVAAAISVEAELAVAVIGAVAIGIAVLLDSSCCCSGFYCD